MLQKGLNTTVLANRKRACVNGPESTIDHVYTEIYHKKQITNRNHEITLKFASKKLAPMLASATYRTKLWSVRCVRWGSMLIRGALTHWRRNPVSRKHCSEIKYATKPVKQEKGPIQWSVPFWIMKNVRWSMYSKWDMERYLAENSHHAQKKTNIKFCPRVVLGMTNNLMDFCCANSV